MHLSTFDLILLGTYAVFIFALAQYISREKNHTKNAKDYFLASKSLPWWAIGGSLIAANISTEQIIGTAGSAYAIGIAIASYEWMSAITILLVGKYLLPIFLKNEIYSMPQFLDKRYGSSLKNMVAGFWIFAYIFVYLTSILWLGSLTINTMTGIDNTLALILLASFSVAYSMYGGLKAVAYTDIIQVVLLVAGGLVTVYIGLNLVSEQAGVFRGLQIMYQQIPEKFDLILSPDNVHYKAMPGISVLIGGMWLINLVYWGLNQYIIQRALAAKNIQEAQKGMLFAGCLKLIIPFIIVFPGIIAAYLVPDLQVADQAYPEMMKLLPDGFKGLVFAALLAAVVSTIASMMNSIATIFTMDLYASWRKKEIDSGVIDAPKLVNIGRAASLISVIIACLLAKPLLSSMDQAFQYMQEAITFFSPGIATIFLFGMFWPKATEKAAIWAMICSVLASTLLSFVWPELPFIDRVVLVFTSCSVVIVLKSIAKPVVDIQPSMISYPSFGTSAIYNMGAVVLTLALSTIYVFLW